MANSAFSYRVPAGLYLSALLAFLALAGLSVAMGLTGQVGPAVLLAALGIGGMVAALHFWMRKRSIVLSPVGMTLPVGPFAAQETMIPYRHMLTVGTEKRTGGTYLTILHRTGKAAIPATALSKDNSLTQLRDLIVQQMNQIAGKARPMHTMRKTSGFAASGPRSFGQRQRSAG